MPEQLENLCERCGAPNVWHGRTRENVCGSCLAEQWEVSAEYDRERDAWLENLENNTP